MHTLEVARCAVAPNVALSRRDRQILALTRRLLRRPEADFGTTLSALREATETLIPAGRIFHLGQRDGSPIVGSIVSGVGLVETSSAILIVRMRHGEVTNVGIWSP